MYFILNVGCASQQSWSLHCMIFFVLQAKKGAVFGEKEDPYTTPSNNEAAIYAELKKLKIRTLAGFSIE